MRGIDRLSQEGTGYSRELAHRDILLPLVEQIDPGARARVFLASRRRATASGQSAAYQRYTAEKPGSPSGLV